MSFLLSLIKEILFPKRCGSCGKIGSFLCAECYNQLVFLSEPVYIALKKNHLNQVIAAAELTTEMRSIIHTLKYQSVKEIGFTLAHLLYFTTNIPKTDLITCVPLHPIRLQERGFNQAAVIAQELAKLTQVRFVDTLQRIVNSTHQASLGSKSARLHHLDNHFCLSIEPNQIANHSILLVDDVCTTGSTLNECAKVLKTNGAASVIGCTIAHGV